MNLRSNQIGTEGEGICGGTEDKHHVENHRIGKKQDWRQRGQVFGRGTKGKHHVDKHRFEY